MGGKRLESRWYSVYSLVLSLAAVHGFVGVCEENQIRGLFHERYNSCGYVALWV